MVVASVKALRPVVDDLSGPKVKDLYGGGGLLSLDRERRLNYGSFSTGPNEKGC